MLASTAVLLALFTHHASGFGPQADRAGLTITPPPGFTDDGALGPPDLSQTPQSRVSEWRAWKGEADGPRLIAGCFETPTEAWAPEAEPLALDKMAQIAVSTAIRAGRPEKLVAGETRHEGDVVTRALEGDGAARIFLGFVHPSSGFVLTSCFSLCTDGTLATPPRNGTACSVSVGTAAMHGPIVRAPAPSAGVRALLAMVRHPTATAWAIAATACLGGALAVMTRKRPRRR